MLPVFYNCFVFAYLTDTSSRMCEINIIVIVLFRAGQRNQLYGFQPGRRSLCYCRQRSLRSHLWHRNSQGL